MNELLFLLLPLAFYSGWKASGRSPNPSSTEKRQLSDNFVRGVNFLLDEEPDKALDVFLNRPEIDEYTAETYLLLGNLFRNRGEVDRALSVHQNLIGRASLNREQKSLTMLALGQDFLAAGMMDRAEQVFTEILQQQDDNLEPAREALRDIYEQTQEWEKAIAVTEVSTQSDNKNADALICNYYCELAESSIETGHLQDANEHLTLASQRLATSTRITVLKARIHYLQKEYDHASELYLSAAKDSPRLIASIYNELFESHKHANRLDDLQSELFNLFEESGDGKVLEYTLLIADTTTPNPKIMASLPSLLESKKLNISTIKQAAELIANRPDLIKEAPLTIIHSALANHLSSMPGYQCAQCGYKMHDFLWRCPACNHWDSVTQL